MQGVTLTIAIILSLLALTVRSRYALAVYIIALLWYPSYLVITMGTIDISVGRIVVAVLLLRCLFNDTIRSKFMWCRLDTLVTLSMVIYVVVYLLTRPLSYSIENRGGFLMDTFFAYIVARFLITDRESLVSVIKCVGIALAPLAILGVIESFSGWYPFLPLQQYCPWYDAAKTWDTRWGLYRAVGPFNHSILFGCGFGMLLPLIYDLRHQKNYWHILAYILSGLALLGGLSSMSSGPWVMVIVIIFCLIVEKWYKHLIKAMLVFFVFSCIFVGIASNRPFYHVLASYANPIGGDAWHRARLIDVTIEHFDEWWMAGYGHQDPGWGPELGMSKTDITNEFILAGVKYGILGMIALCWILVIAFRYILNSYKKTTDPGLRSLYLSFGTVMFAVVVCWMSTSFFGQIVNLFYIILGIIGSACNPETTFIRLQRSNVFSTVDVYPHL
jgi:hypothetical protein